LKYIVAVGDRSVAVELVGDQVLVDGKPASVRLTGTGPVRRLHADGASLELVAVPLLARGQWRFLVRGHRIDVGVQDERMLALAALSAGKAGGGSGGTLRAPMPGLVVRVLVGEGQAVKAGDGLVVVEAMKMENELRAARSGVVRRVLTFPGKAVERGDALLELDEPPSRDAGP
jgi:pyruvate carboxylase subunit B